MLAAEAQHSHSISLIRQPLVPHQTSLVRHRFQYDLSMSEKKTRITITVDPHLAAYAERLVETGKAPSVSAAFNDAFAERLHRDRRARRWWAARAADAAADPAVSARVARMKAHIDEQLRHFEHERDSQ
jgi:Arc/MetJ-type ribon-helix-helix transcriptional regulator